VRKLVQGKFCRVVRLIRWKRWQVGIAILALIVLGVVGALDNALPYMLLSHHNYAVEVQPKVLTEFGAKAETLRFTSRDRITTVGWWIPTAQPEQSPTLIVLHGLGATRQDHLASMLPLWQKGINLLLLDLREHGESGGQYFTYGYHEWQDITAAIDTLEQRQGKLSQPLVVLGISVGGTVAIAATAQDQRIQGVITIGTFADLTTTIQHQSPWLSDAWRTRSMLRAEQIGQFKIADASPKRNIQQVQVPVLIVHAEQDDYIPLSDAQQLFAAANQPKQFHLLDNANHANMIEIHGDDLRQTIEQFITLIRVLP
jgi:uncharacterized protein